MEVYVIYSPPTLGFTNTLLVFKTVSHTYARLQSPSVSSLHTQKRSVTQRDTTRLDPICRFCPARSFISAEICAHSE